MNELLRRLWREHRQSQLPDGLTLNDLIAITAVMKHYSRLAVDSSDFVDKYGTDCRDYIYDLMDTDERG